MKRIVMAALLVVAGGAAATTVNTISREQWTTQMGNLLPAAMCQEGSYFRACFAISASDCHKTATATTATCLRQYTDQMPATLKQPEDGAHWGQLVGTCAGTLYDHELKAKMRNDAKCKDLSYWK
jgi:hypothetical protein